MHILGVALWSHPMSQCVHTLRGDLCTKLNIRSRFEFKHNAYQAHRTTGQAHNIRKLRKCVARCPQVGTVRVFWMMIFWSSTPKIYIFKAFGIHLLKNAEGTVIMSITSASTTCIPKRKGIVATKQRQNWEASTRTNTRSDTRSCWIQNDSKMEHAVYWALKLHLLN